MPALSFNDWLLQYSLSQYGAITDETGTPDGTSNTPPLFPIPENTVAPGIPAYTGWQEPDYNARSAMPNHWLNTMNAFAPTARNEMQGLLGMGAINQPRMPVTTPAPQPFTPPKTPLKPVGPNSNGTVGIDPSGRLRFDTDYYGVNNIPGNSFAPQPFTPPQVPLKPVSNTSNGTVGIDPTGRLRFDTDYYGGTQNLPTTQLAQSFTQPSTPLIPVSPNSNGTVVVSNGRLTFAPTTGLLGSGK